MEQTEKSNIGVLVGLLLVVFTGVVALLVLFGPRKEVPRLVPSGPTVFGDSRSSAELQARLAGRDFAGRERGSALDDVPGISEETEPDGPESTPGDGDPAARGGTIWRVVKRAENFFFRFKKQARFKNSIAVKKWKKDFLAYPDLRQINDDYYNKDGKASTFIRRTLASKNFGKVVRDNINSPDIHAFLMGMMASPSVTEASKVMTKEYKLQPAIDKLNLPGIGSLGSLKKAGKQFQNGKKISADNTMDVLGLDKKMLDPDALIKKAMKKKPD